MHSGCPLNGEGETCHVQPQELFTRTWLAFKEIGGMCPGLDDVQRYDRIITANRF